MSLKSLRSVVVVVAVMGALLLTAAPVQASPVGGPTSVTPRAEDGATLWTGLSTFIDRILAWVGFGTSDTNVVQASSDTGPGIDPNGSPTTTDPTTTDPTTSPDTGPGIDPNG